VRSAAGFDPFTDRIKSAMDQGDDDLRCSFCHKSQAEVAKIIASASERAYICDECIKACNFILETDPKVSHPITGRTRLR